MALAVPSPKLQALLKDFQQIASMSGYLNHAYDAPQLRLFFTLYGRVMASSPGEALVITPRLQSWCEELANRLREGSSGTILQPQVQVSAPLIMPDGRDYIVATLTFATKVTETSYLRIRTAILAAYQDAVKMREAGFPPLPAAESTLRPAADPISAPVAPSTAGAAADPISAPAALSTPSPVAEPIMAPAAQPASTPAADLSASSSDGWLL